MGPLISRIIFFVDEEDDSLDTATATEYYRDLDLDGFGDVAHPVLACTPPDHFVTQANDCDDDDADVHPDAEEICDGIDKDCD